MTLKTTLPVGSQVPRRGHLLSRGIGRLVLWLMGWRLAGAIPNEPKMVMIGAPHTSNMDGVVSIATLVALGLRAGTMIKDSAFKGALGPVLRFFGALPVDRKSPKGVVEQSVDAFKAREGFLLLIAPEGTRSGPVEWKRGFWHIAQGAGVPVLPAAIDYQKKLITFGAPMSPGGDYVSDFATLLDFYAAHARPRHPERLSKPLCDRIGQTWQPPPEKKRP